MSEICWLLDHTDSYGHRYIWRWNPYSRDEWLGLCRDFLEKVHDRELHFGQEDLEVVTQKLSHAIKTPTFD